MINTNDINDYKYGIQSWPAHKKGWRFVIPFVEEGDEKLASSAYYVKLKDLLGSLKSIKKERRYQLKGYDNKRILLIKDELLYKEGYYLSPDLQKPIADGWNITLLASGFCLIIIQIVLRPSSICKNRKSKDTGHI